MTETQRALLKTGATLRTISPEQGLVNGWHGRAWGHYFPIDKQVSEVLGSDYDMLVLPGGERSIAKLQQSAHTKRIIGHFLDAGKPIAAIDHGVQLLAIPDKLKGRTVVAIEGFAEALTAAGGILADESETLVIDGFMVTARSADEVPAFVEQLLKVFSEAASVKKAA